MWSIRLWSFILKLDVQGYELRLCKDVKASFICQFAAISGHGAKF